MTTEGAAAFLECFRTLVMASSSPEGAVHASTAPFVYREEGFYLLISTVAQHGRNLLTPQRVSLLFAEDEAECLSPFARKRLTIEADTAEVFYGSDAYDTALEAFRSRFDAQLVDQLLQMGDFHLFRLSPVSGSAVMGFGKAYRLNEKLEVATPIRGQHGGNHG